MAARQAERARRAAKWVAKLCVAAISTALLASPAGAQQAGKVSQLPFASTPTNGTELIYLVQNGISTKCTLASCVPGFAGFNLTITDSVHTVANVNHILFNGPTVGGVSPNGTVTITIPPAFDLILTDGAHTVANVNHILFTGAVVGGTTPNGTVTVSVPSPLTVTDGVNTVTPTSNLLFASGFTVSGTTPNAITTPNWATDAQIWTSVAHVFVDPAGANSAIAPTTVNESGGVFSINFGAAINVQLPLVHADCPCTVANPTGVYAGLSGNLTLTQSATGSDLIGTWGSTWKFSGGTPPTLTTTANANDVAPFYCRTTTFCVVTLIGNAE